MGLCFYWQHQYSGCCMIDACYVRGIIVIVIILPFCSHVYGVDDSIWYPHTIHLFSWFLFTIDSWQCLVQFSVHLNVNFIHDYCYDYCAKMATLFPPTSFSFSVSFVCFHVSRDYSPWCYLLCVAVLETYLWLRSPAPKRVGRYLIKLTCGI